jgi:citrate lyase beta subunit
VTSLDEAFLADLDARLESDDRRRTERYPGDGGARQPVHTVYTSAGTGDATTPGQWGEEALRLLDATVPDARRAAEVTGIESVDAAVHERAVTKLRAQPVEDLRLDFEDGYSGHDEDTDAGSAGAALAGLLAAPGGPSFAGVRIKSLEPATRRRGLRTLDLTVESLVSRGPLPDGFLVTLPKVTSVDQVQAMVHVCERMEVEYRLPPGRLRFEIQVETPQAIVGADGTATVAPMVHAAGPRCVALHYGTYDYSAACGIAAAQQSLDHPVADHAKAVMLVAVAGTGVRLSDGSTNVMPLGDPAEVVAAMRLHAGLVHRSLQRGLYQGWDMHPGHLVTRYLATYAFYRSGLGPASERLRVYTSGSTGGVLDEPATAQALAAFLTRGLQCGAVGEDEVADRTGITSAALAALARPRAVG